MYENSAIETAARFGEIPFVEFTSDLIGSTFDTLVDANIKQMEAYVDMVNTLQPGLTNYINNTVDSVTLGEIGDFISNLNLPTPTDTENLIKAVEAGYNYQLNPPIGNTTQTVTSPTESVLQTVIEAVAPIAQDLIKLIPLKMKDTSNPPKDIFNNDALNTTSTPTSINISADSFKGKLVTATVPNYNLLYQSIAATIASNKYSLLQNMAKMGLLRLVVTDGQIETRITFQTWESHENREESSHSDKNKSKQKEKSKMAFLGVFGKKKKEVSKTITVNTAKTYHRDTSGSSVQIFGRVLINFKTDYMPLNF